MREIKFRAWDKEHCEMCYPVQVLSWTESSEIEDFEGVRPSGGAACLYSGEFELMQYTGLKDKNGKDVYESDVIQSGRTKLYYVIKWEDESASWIALCTDTSKDYCLGSYGWREAEIVGNIYESPELLEEIK